MTESQIAAIDWPAWSSACATWIGAVAASAAVYVASKQLKQLNTTLELDMTAISQAAETLRVSGIMAIVQLESEIHTRANQMREAADRLEIQAAKKQPLRLPALKQHYGAARESYLNAVDRLCFIILNGVVPERDWRAEYRQYLLGIVGTYKDQFQLDTPFTNIKQLHENWIKT